MTSSYFCTTGVWTLEHVAGDRLIKIQKHGANGFSTIVLGRFPTVSAKPFMYEHGIYHPTLH